MDSWKTRRLFPALGMIPIDRAAATGHGRRSMPPRQCCAVASCSGSSRREPAAATACCTEATPAPLGWPSKVGCPDLSRRASIGTDDPAARGESAAVSASACTIRIGRPINVEHDSATGDDRLVLRRVTDELMYEMRDLTGQEYVDQ